MEGMMNLTSVPRRTRPSGERGVRITSAERDVLLDVAVGLTDEAVARRRKLSRRGVQNRLASVYRKLGVQRAAQTDLVRFAPRCRTIFLALQLGILDTEEVLGHEQDLLGRGLIPTPTLIPTPSV